MLPDSSLERLHFLAGNKDPDIPFWWFDQKRKAVTFPVVSAPMKKPLQTNGLPSGNSHNYVQIGIFDREIIF
jgi:hypothetical protein